MVDIVRCLPNDEVCLNYGLDPKNTSVYADYTISGFVSSCEHGFGRSTADRQFVYVNKRPVGTHRFVELLMKSTNNIIDTNILPLYLTSKSHQVYMIDVNVTPDKRMVFFEREKELLALIRSSLLATFHPLLGAYTSVEDNRSKDLENFPGPSNSNSSTPLSSHSDLFSVLKANSVKASSPVYGGPTPKKSKTDGSISASKAYKVPGMERNIEETSNFDALLIVSDDEETEGASPCIPPFQTTTDLAKTLDAFAFKPIPKENSSSAKVAQPSICSKGESEKLFEEFCHEKKAFGPSLMRDLSRGFENNIEKDRVAIEKMETTMDQEEHSVMIRKENDVEASCITITTENVENSGSFLRPQQKIPFSMAALRKRLNSLRDAKAKEQQASQVVEFHAGLSPAENELAEKELDRTLKKSDFAQMSVIGQFNKGFIITRLRNHLFLVDQHASDEKYNFERFQKKARVETQRLIQ
ncbi:DNA mismatch repair protein [Ostertagia ostertagi]